MTNLKKYVLLSALTLTAATTLVGPSAVAEENSIPASSVAWKQRSFAEIKNMIDQVIANADRTYIIQWGDTLSTISEVTGINVRDLAQINQISNPDFIIAGASLTFNPITKEVSYQEGAGKEEEVYTLHDPIENTPENLEDNSQAVQTIPKEKMLLLAPAEDFTLNKEKNELHDQTTPVEVLEEPTTTTEIQVDTSDFQVIAPLTVINSTEETTTSELVDTTSLVEEPEESLLEVTNEETTAEPIETTIEEQSTSLTLDLHEIDWESEPTTTTEAEIDSVTVFSDPHVAFSQIVKDKGVTSDEAEMWSSIINSESGWNHYIANPSSGAYGLPQALPGSKMASHGSDWETNPYTQLAWMYDYMVARYGSISGAWSFWQANRWY